MPLVEVVDQKIADGFALQVVAVDQLVDVNLPGPHDLGKVSPLARRVLPRILDLNARLRIAAGRHDVAVLDVFPHAVTTDPRLWSADRLHTSPLGHARIASGMAHTLGLPDHHDWIRPLPPQPPVPAFRAVGAEVRWAVDFLGPWLWRRLRGRSSGDGCSAEKPQLGPVELAADA